MISFNFRRVEYDFRHFRISCCWCPRRREFCDTAPGITIKKNPLVSSMIESKRGSRSFSSVTFTQYAAIQTSVHTHVYLWREWSSDEDVHYRRESTQIMFDERKVFITIDSATNICRCISIRKIQTRSIELQTHRQKIHSRRQRDVLRLMIGIMSVNNSSDNRINLLSLSVLSLDPF